MILALDRVRFGYGEKTVLDGVSLTAGPGQTLALLGPNGSGKTTAFRLLAGQARPWSGQATMDGHEAAGLNPVERARRLAFVPQREEPAFAFTAREVVLTGRLPWSKGLFETPADHEAARLAMEQAGCLSLADRAVDTLSGGEAQRVLIARALAQESPAILLDEPTNHLDPRFQAETARLCRLLAQHGKTVVAATHDLNWALAVADRLVLLSEGRALADGPPDEVVASDAFERAYAVPFERLSLAGRTVVFPRL